MNNRSKVSDPAKTPEGGAARGSLVSEWLGLGAHAEVSGVPGKDLVRIVEYASRAFVVVGLIIALAVASAAFGTWNRPTMDDHRGAGRAFSRSPAGLVGRG